MEVVFTKARSDTILRAAFHSTLADGGRAYGGECSEWFITFNGKECTSPAPITTSRHKYGYGRYGHDGWLTVPGQVGGFCRGTRREFLAAGNISIGVSARPCYRIGFPFTGPGPKPSYERLVGSVRAETTSSIVVEEYCNV